MRQYERKYKMATPKKTKNGWTILVYAGVDENGKKKYRRLSGETKKEVEKKAADFIKEINGHSVSNMDMTVGGCRGRIYSRQRVERLFP